jgi:mono/diheme cytochrome c family protein
MRRFRTALRGSLGRRGLIAALVLLSGVLLVVIGIHVFSPDRPSDRPAARPARLSKAQLRARGKELYGNYCVQCHGVKGGGDGPAARYLYPKPRNFQLGYFRLVTTDNRLPSDNDLLRVITRGMPGSAMFPFAHLEEVERRALVVHVRHLTRTGIEERIRARAAADDEVISAKKMKKGLDLLTVPGKTLRVPPGLPAASKASLARGRKHYLSLCAPCHGPTGKGDGVQNHKDDEGYLVRPRDYTRGIFKGGREKEQLYARIVLGMPGAPMVSAPRELKPADIGDLVNFVQSFSTPAAQAQVEHQRRRLVARRVKRSLNGSLSEADWRSAQPVRLVVTPLWWRNYPEPALQVAALHDGRTLAIRLRWQDQTRDDRVVRPQDFEDMAAVQLFRGKPEPFLGMGATGQPVDVWLWRAGRATNGGRPADVDTTYPNMAVDLYPFEKEGKKSPFLTARAVGNAHSDPARGFTGSSLQARGFGTLSMRPRPSQVVSAAGSWEEAGRWTVILRRPLKVGKEDGLALAPGERVSIAFALWDGSAGDRNGQKLVSIWHDLELE